MNQIDIERLGSNQFERDLEEYDRFNRLSSFVICLLCVLLLLFCLVTPANAEEVTENVDVTSETGVVLYMDDGSTNPSDPIDGEGDQGAGTTGDGSGDNGGSTEPYEEPLETYPEPSETPVVDVSQGSINAIVDGVTGAQTSSEPSGPVTVDVSEQSIMAIADAVTVSDSESLVFVKDGVTWTVKNHSDSAVLWDDFLSDYDSYKYKVVSYVSGHAYVYLSNNLIYFDSGLSGYEVYYHGTRTGNNFYLKEKNVGSIFSSTIIYSNHSIYKSDDTLYYASDEPEYYTINFSTGFELASIKVLSGEAYYVPSFTYEAHEFIGAFTDETFENAFVDGTVIDEDITLYLNFSEIQYDIGGLVSQLLGVAKGLDVIESQLWIILVVGMMYFVYKFFRLFF